MLIIALVAGIGGDPFYKTKRTFWSKRNIGEPSYNHRLEEINSSAMTRRIIKKLKGFPVLPFSTMIRKPLGRKRANPKIEGPRLFREIENGRLWNNNPSFPESLGNNNEYRMDIPFYRIAR